jgi:hypothetical protein
MRGSQKTGRRSCVVPPRRVLLVLSPQKSLGSLRTDRTVALRSLREVLAEPVVSKKLGITGGRAEIDDILRFICPTGPAQPPAAPDRPDEMFLQHVDIHVLDLLAESHSTLSRPSQEESGHVSSIDNSDSRGGWNLGMTMDAPIAEPTDQHQSGWQGLSHPQVAQGESLNNGNCGHGSFRTSVQVTDVPLAAFNTQSQAGSQYQPWQPDRLGESPLASLIAGQDYLGNTATSVPALTPGQTSDSSSMNPHTPIPPNRQASTPSSDTPSYPEFDSYIRYNSVMNDDSIPGPSHTRDVSSSPDAGRRPSMSSEVSDQQPKRARQTSPARRNPLPLMTLEDLQTRECDMIQSVLRQLAVRFEGMADHLSKRSRIIAPVKAFLLNVSPF